MSYYPKHQQRDRRSQQGSDRNPPISPNSARVYRPKNQASPIHPDLSSSPLSPPSARSPMSSWNSPPPDYLSTSAPGRQPAFPSSSPSGPTFSSSYNNSHADQMQRHSTQSRAQNQPPPQQQQQKNAKPRSQSFGTGPNNTTVSYMRKLTVDDIRKFCEKSQTSFWSGEDQPQAENGGTQEWKRDLALEIPAQVPQKITEVKVKKNSLRGKTFIVFEGEPEEKASSLWLALPHKLSSIRTYQEGEEFFTKAATYISRRMKAYLKDKGSVSRINYKIIIESKPKDPSDQRRESENDLGSSKDSNEQDLGSSKDSTEGDQESEDKKTTSNNENIVIVFVVAYQ